MTGRVNRTDSRDRTGSDQMINAMLKLTRTADDGAEMFRKYYLVADFADVIKGLPGNSGFAAKIDFDPS